MKKSGKKAKIRIANIDEKKQIWYTKGGRNARRDTINGGGCFLIPEEVKSVFVFFAFLEQREVMLMYITWETLFLFCTLIVAIISLVLDILNKFSFREILSLL